MKSMKLSIIVPVYNMEAGGKLKYCMDSLVNQDMTDFEIITVDDKSTDASLSVLEDYQNRYPEIVKVIASPNNRKQGGAKNLGLELATGEWIGFIDSDDWINPKMYALLIQKAEETGADLVGCNYSLVNHHTMEIGKIVSNNSMDQTGVLTEEGHKKMFLRAGSMVIKIYKHEIIKANNLCFPEQIFYEDNCAGPLWSFYFTQFEKVDEALYYYYQHEASTVHHISDEKCENRMVAGNLLVEECKARGWYEQYKSELEFRFTELYYVNTLFSYVSSASVPKLSFLKKLRKGMLTQFPEFQRNAYYIQLIGSEEKKLIGYHIKSVFYFLCYYKALNYYRKIIRSK